MTVRLCNIYRSPNADHTHFTELFTLNLNLFSHSEFLIVGDLNLPNVDWGSFTNRNANYEIFLDFLSDNNFSQLVSAPTRGVNILDVLLVRNVPINMVSIEPPFSRSDHNSIVFGITHDNNDYPEILESRNYALANWDRINWEIASIDWTNILNATTVSLAYDTFVDILNDILHRNIPLNRNDPRVRYPLYLRRLYFQTQRATRLSPNSLHAANKLKEYRDALSCFEIEKEKRLLKSAKFKDYYKIFRDRLNPTCDSIPALKVNGNTLVSPLEKAEAFSEFFSSVYTSSFIGPLAECQHPVRFSMPPITVHVVAKAIKEIQPKVNTSPDTIPNIVYRNCCDSIVVPLAIIFQNSMINGEVPELWKRATVKPVFKKGNRSIIDNYRPVSLTCSSSKIMEKIIISAMSDFLESNDLLNDSQAGFRPKRSTTTQMCETVSKLNFLLCKNRTVDCVFFDFRKAFDSIDHHLLTYKLQFYGFDRGLIKWITYYLSGRKQKVMVENIYSESADVLSGVPQGSCSFIHPLH